MRSSYVSALLRAKVALTAVGVLTLASALGGTAAPLAASAKPAASAPIAVFVGFQAVVPSTGVVRHRIEPADGSIALARQAHQVPLLILLGVAKGQARLLLEYADGHTQERTIEVRTGTPPATESLRLHVAQVHDGRAALNLKSFSAASSGLVEVKVAPNNQDYIIRAIKEGKTSVILIQDDGSVEQKMVEILP